MKARVPASAANLGPGFDTLALALAMYTEVEIEPARELMITSTGEGSTITPDAEHLAARVAREIVGHDRMSIKIDSNIPLTRGLGSSASLIVATAAAAGVDDPLALAARFEGHCENAAASVNGGLVAATFVSGKPVATPLFLDPDLAFVLLIPDRLLPTKEARAALPEKVTLEQAAFNLGRLGLLIAALGDGSNLFPELMDDRLHQSPRTALFPESQFLIDALVMGGAAAACWSGAGPTLIGVAETKDKAEKIRRAGEKAMAENRVPGRAIIMDVDHGGLQVE